MSFLMQILVKRDFTRNHCWSQKMNDDITILERETGFSFQVLILKDAI